MSESLAVPADAHRTKTASLPWPASSMPTEHSTCLDEALGMRRRWRSSPRPHQEQVAGRDLGGENLDGFALAHTTAMGGARVQQGTDHAVGAAACAPRGSSSLARAAPRNPVGGARTFTRSSSDLSRVHRVDRRR